MSRNEDLKSDPAFRQAVQAVRGAASVLSGVQMSYGEAEVLVTFALVTFANGGGLTEPSLGRLARFAPDAGAAPAEPARAAAGDRSRDERLQDDRFPDAPAGAGGGRRVH